MSKKKIRVGGPPTGTHRTNCRAASCHVDTHIVAWPAVHERRQKNAWCDTFDNIFFRKNFRYSPHVKFNNGGINGIKIRLHSLGHKRMDQGTTRDSSEFLLDYDVNRYGNSYERKPGRGYFPDHVSSDAGSRSMDHKIFFDEGQRSSALYARIQMQRWPGSTLQIYPKMDESWRKMARRKTGEERRSSQKGCRCQINLCSWFEKRSRKLLLSTIVKIVLLRPLRSSILCVAAEMVGPLIKWKKLNLETLSWTSLNFMANMLHSAEKILETQISFPPIPGQKWPGFFCAWIKG